MKSKAVFFLIVVFFVSSLAQIQMLDPKKTNRKSDLTIDPSDDLNSLLEYQRMLNTLKSNTMNTMKSVGYKLSAIRDTLNATIAAKAAIRNCYTNKSNIEFHKCASEAIDNARNNLAAIQLEAQQSTTTKTSMWPRRIVIG